MAKKYKPRRNKLKNHDQGHDRHAHGVAHETKQARLAQGHELQRSRRRRKAQSS